MKKAAFLFVIVAFICSGYENSHQQKIANFFGLNTNYEVKTTIISKEDSIPIELANIPKHVAGVAIPERGEIYLFRERTNSYPFGSIEQVYEHELSHIYLFRTIGFRAPRWFDEGVAMKLSGEWGFSDEFYLALSLPKVAFSNFSLSKLEKNFSGYEGASRTSYALSRAFVKDLFVNDADLYSFINEIKKHQSFETAFRQRFGINSDYAFKSWAKKLPWWGPLLVFITSTNSIWLIVLLLFLLAVFVTIKKRLQWKKRWENEEREKDYLQ